MTLREDLKSALVALLAQGTWAEIRETHEKVELAWREDLGPGSGKPKYVNKVLAELGDEELVELGQRCVQVFSKQDTVAVQDALWWLDADGAAAISEVTRLNVADALDGRVMHPREGPNEFLRHFAIVPTGGFDSPIFGYDSNSTLHMKEFDVASFFSANPKWMLNPVSHRDLLDYHHFQAWSDERFFRFLEALVHPTTRQGEEQAEWVMFVNQLLAADGFRLEEVDRMSGQPLFSVRRRDRGVGGRPKNLIFASTGPKPELGLQDAVNNDVVILKHAERCLIYEDPIPENGLTWDNLVGWWAAARGEDRHDKKVRRRLGERLSESLGSEPEKRLFAAYFRIYQPLLASRLPALIPQVYLHYDPATIRELQTRGESKRFQTQRMDYLLLLPNRVRVVLEVDGMHHYSDGEGESARPSPRKYAKTVQADRELRLKGYEVYRFGGHELRDRERAEETVRDFFDNLLRYHGLLK